MKKWNNLFSSFSHKEQIRKTLNVDVITYRNNTTSDKLLEFTEKFLEEEPLLGVNSRFNIGTSARGAGKSFIAFGKVAHKIGGVK